MSETKVIKMNKKFKIHLNKGSCHIVCEEADRAIRVCVSFGAVPVVSSLAQQVTAHTLLNYRQMSVKANFLHMVLPQAEDLHTVASFYENNKWSIAKKPQNFTFNFQREERVYEQEGSRPRWGTHKDN